MLLSREETLPLPLAGEGRGEGSRGATRFGMMGA
jgi:hypothetical protein